MHRQTMLQVIIADENPVNLRSANSTNIPHAVDGQGYGGTRPRVIEIEIAGTVMRFDGKADLSMVRAVFECYGHDGPTCGNTQLAGGWH